MADRRPALAGAPVPQPLRTSVTLGEVRPGSILQVAAWPDTLAVVHAAFAELLGVAVPEVGWATADPNLTIVAVAPGRFLVAGMAPDLASRLAAALPSSEAVVTDLLHGRTILRIEGEAAELLTRAVAIDLDTSVFPPRRVAQTAIHHVDVLLHRLNRTTFDAWVGRSFAEALTEWLLDAAADLGVSFHS